MLRWSHECWKASSFHTMGSGTGDMYHGSFVFTLMANRPRWGQLNTAQAASNILGRIDHLSEGPGWGNLTGLPTYSFCREYNKLTESPSEPQSTEPFREPCSTSLSRQCPIGSSSTPQQLRCGSSAPPLSPPTTVEKQAMPAQSHFGDVDMELLLTIPQILSGREDRPPAQQRGIRVHEKGGRRNLRRKIIIQPPLLEPPTNRLHALWRQKHQQRRIVYHRRPVIFEAPLKQRHPRAALGNKPLQRCTMAQQLRPHLRWR